MKICTKINYYKKLLSKYVFAQNQFHLIKFFLYLSYYMYYIKILLIILNEKL